MLRPIKARATKLRDETSKAVNEAMTFFESLAAKAEREMATKKDAASYRAARLIGHGATQGLETTKKIETQRDITWDNLRILKDDVSTTVRSLRDIRHRTSAELSGFYILDMRSFSGVTERLAKNGERLAAFLDGEGSSLQKARSVNGIIQSMREAREEAMAKQLELQQIIKDTTLAESSLKELTNETELLAKNPGLNEILSIEKELRRESRAFRTETLAHLQRPMRRLREISERGAFPIEPDQREAISQYLKSPYKSFLSPSTGKYLQIILENMKRALDSGKMEFKSRKAIRISNQLKQLIETGQLADKQKHGVDLVTRRRRLLADPEIRRIYNERKYQLQRIDASKKNLETLETRLINAKNVLYTTEQRISQLAELAENKTREYMKQDVHLERSLGLVFVH